MIGQTNNFTPRTDNEEKEFDKVSKTYLVQSYEEKETSRASSSKNILHLSAVDLNDSFKTENCELSKVE